MKRLLVLLIIITGINNINCKYNTTINKDININIRKPYYVIEYNTNLNNNEHQELVKQIVNYGDSIILLDNIYENDGYIFKEWNTAADGSGETYLSNQEVSNLSNIDKDKIVLYAIWTKIE